MLKNSEKMPIPKSPEAQAAVLQSFGLYYCTTLTFLRRFAAFLRVLSKQQILRNDLLEVGKVCYFCLKNNNDSFFLKTTANYFSVK